MEKKKMICFDLDGTLADLYAVPDWLPKLRSYDSSPYIEAAPIYHALTLSFILKELKKHGWEIAIITWLSKESTAEYDTAVRKAKKEWLAAHEIPYDRFYGIKYGRTKADSIRKRCSYGVLIDDNAKIRKGWHLGSTIDPTKGNLLEELTNLLKEKDW